MYPAALPLLPISLLLIFYSRDHPGHSWSWAGPAVLFVFDVFMIAVAVSSSVLKHPADQDAPGFKLIHCTGRHRTTVPIAWMLTRLAQ